MAKHYCTITCADWMVKSMRLLRWLLGVGLSWLVRWRGRNFAYRYAHGGHTF